MKGATSTVGISTGCCGAPRGGLGALKSITKVYLATLSENSPGREVFSKFAHKSFVGKILSDKNQLRTQHRTKRSRWVYEGSEEKPT